MALPQVHRLETAASTQDLLHELAGRGEPGGTVVVAAEQRSGRGSRGSSWASPRGGLWMSVLVRPGVAPALEVLSLRVALNVSAALERSASGVRVEVKWPNDLMLLGRKLGGILCEGRWQGGSPAWVAVGIGINVRNRVPAELAGVAASLEEVAPDLEPAMLVAPVAAAVAEAGIAVGHLGSGECDRFGERDWLRGRRVYAPVPGIPDGVLPDGRLRIRGPDGEVTAVRSGPVRLTGDG